MAPGERIVERLGRLRGIAAGLGCAPSDALAVAVLLAAACAGLGLVWLAGRPAPAAAPGADAGALVEAEALPGTRAPAEAATEAGPVVHVSGHVGRPGVYDLEAGARVAHAVEAAGGALPGARLEALNLARVVADGEQIHVPAPGEDAAVEAGPAGGGAWRPDGRLDINRATAADFEELPGIGPVLAERIVAHREQMGGFQSIGDLLAVRGIGEKTLASLADLLAP